MRRRPAKDMLRRAAGLTTVVAVLLLTGCKDADGLKPKSGGRPYDVVVTGGDAGAVTAVGDMLRSVTTAGLPQREGAFSVTATDGEPEGAMRYARCIVWTVTDSNGNGTTSVRFERDVYAKPQIIIYVCGPSAAQIRTDAQRTGRTVSAMINRFEREAAIAELRRRYNTKIAQTADSIFGHTIRVAPEMTGMKTGQDFIWVSDLSATAMGNVCVYSYRGDSLDATRAVAVRDSVMRANVPGETPQMFMTTAATPRPAATVRNIGGRKVMVMRGLWEMEGGAMGGPFVSHTIADTARGRIITAEAFVFAPGKKKGNIIRQLEAALYTLK